MTNDPAAYDRAYRGIGDLDGPPPWNIGEPQLELAGLVRRGHLRSQVLDAGCGVGELSLAAAADGFTVVGIDSSPTAIETARGAAAQRNLTNVTFEVADITTRSGYDGHFTTVVDSGLFHSLPEDHRDAYLRSIHRATAPGASFFALVFTKEVFPDDRHGETSPNGFDEAELIEAVSRFWPKGRIQPATIRSLVPRMTGASAVDLMFERDDKGRYMIPAHLLEARKAD